MPKRRRLLTPLRHKSKQNQTVPKVVDFKVADDVDKEVSAARGRLMGALKEVLEPTAEESDTSYEPSPTKKEKYNNHDERESEEEEKEYRPKTPPRQSYVLKLFDRSVDLSQFEEDSPLYPICRAWMINQPKINYKEYGQSIEESEVIEDSVELPGPEGPPISRIPELLPEQKARSKDNINLNYRSSPPPSRDQLLRAHAARWAGVRQAWIDHSQRVEARYSRSQALLNQINVNAL